MSAMRWTVFAILALGAVGLLLAQAEVGKSADGNSEWRALRQQVEQLQSRVKTLEDRLAKLESAKPPVLPRFEILPRSSNAPPAILFPRERELRERSGQSPQIWGQGEINGWPFYFIPCSGS